MTRSGHRHRLVLYTYILNRWWKLVLAIGIFLIVLALEFKTFPIPLTGHRSMFAPQWLVLIATGSGIYALVLALVCNSRRQMIDGQGDGVGKQEKLEHRKPDHVHEIADVP